MTDDDRQTIHVEQKDEFPSWARYSEAFDKTAKPTYVAMILGLIIAIAGCSIGVAIGSGALFFGAPGVAAVVIVIGCWISDRWSDRVCDDLHNGKFNVPFEQARRESYRGD